MLCILGGQTVIVDALNDTRTQDVAMSLGTDNEFNFEYVEVD